MNDDLITTNVKRELNSQAKPRGPTFITSTADLDKINGHSVVYFVLIGKAVKIGFSTNLKERLKSFETTATQARLLLAVKGNKELERQIHLLLADLKIARELFRNDGRIFNFILVVQKYNLNQGLQWLKDDMPPQQSVVNAPTPLTPLELLRKISVKEAAAMNGISPDNFRRHYKHLIRKITPRRDVVQLSDAINLPPP